MTLALGLMSGTSADGVSLALASFQGRKIKVLANRTYPYPSALRKTLLGAGNLKTPEISRLNVTLGKCFADCAAHFIKESRQKPSRIAVVGSHGHTVWHAPSPYPLPSGERVNKAASLWNGVRDGHTLQIGEPSFIAERTGIPVVADFRARDLAAGGEGAPLIPYFDDYFFGGGPLRALQNIGGIGNVTLVGKSVKQVTAFDTGPGNCLMDWAAQKITKGRLQYDRGGKIAARGSVHAKIAVEMSRHPYFLKRPPKSTGRELFNETFIPRALLNGRPENLMATLTYFTAHTIYESYKRFLPSPFTLPLSPKGRGKGEGVEIVVSGGGALNPILMKLLKKLFAPVPVRTIEDYGIPALAKEPAAFAFFALRALQGKINHAPSGTGARRACILGKIIP